MRIARPRRMYITPTTLQLTALGEAPTLESIRRTLGDPRRLDFETRVELRLFIDDRGAQWPEPARALVNDALVPVVEGELVTDVGPRSRTVSLRLGPSIEELQDAALGTCAFLTTLSGLAENQPHLLQRLITDDGEHAWARFYRRHERRRPTAEFVQLDGRLPPAGLNAPTWLGAIERAHALWKGGTSRLSADVYFELTGTPASPGAIARTCEPSAFRRIAAAVSGKVVVTAGSAPPFLRPQGLQLPGLIACTRFRWSRRLSCPWSSACASDRDATRAGGVAWRRSRRPDLAGIQSRISVRLGRLVTAEEQRRTNYA